MPFSSFITYASLALARKAAYAQVSAYRDSWLIHSLVARRAQSALKPGTGLNLAGIFWNTNRYSSIYSWYVSSCWPPLSYRGSRKWTDNTLLTVGKHPCAVVQSSLGLENNALIIFQNDYVYLRVSDSHRFRFKTQEAEVNCFAPTWKIASTLIAKRLGHFERSNNIFVRTHTNIPVPQPRYLHLKEALITDFIPGSMLLECWDSLSPFYQFCIACT